MNHHRASHRACIIPGGGTCVKLYYKNHEVSLAMDGENTRVYPLANGEHLAEFTGTRGESVLEAFHFIDGLT